MPDSDLSHAVTTLHAHGLPPDIISTSLNVPLTTVNALILTAPRPPVLDEDLAAGIRDLAREAINQARLELKYAPTERRIALIKQLLSSLGRHIAQPASTDDGVRQLVESMFAQMKHLPDNPPPTSIPRPLPLDVSSRPVYDPDSAETGTVAADPDDQDEGPRTPAV